MLIDVKVFHRQSLQAFPFYHNYIAIAFFIRLRNMWNNLINEHYGSTHPPAFKRTQTGATPSTRLKPFDVLAQTKNKSSSITYTLDNASTLGNLESTLDKATLVSSLADQKVNAADVLPDALPTPD